MQAYSILKRTENIHGIADWSRVISLENRESVTNYAGSAIPEGEQFLYYVETWEWEPGEQPRVTERINLYEWEGE